MSAEEQAYTFALLFVIAFGCSFASFDSILYFNMGPSQSKAGHWRLPSHLHESNRRRVERQRKASSRLGDSDLTHCSDSLDSNRLRHPHSNSGSGCFSKRMNYAFSGHLQQKRTEGLEVKKNAKGTYHLFLQQLIQYLVILSCIDPDVIV